MSIRKEDVWLANGNESIAYAAMHAGVDYFSHYPGSPVNGIEPKLKQLNVQHKCGIQFNDALNEHIAALGAMGASMTGARSMLVMKHVGLNIAADPLNYVGYAGVRGGMVIIVGTDPGANSSTGEEDVHWYAKQFNLPLFEPTSIQEIYDTTLLAFELSEELELPVMLFVTGLICHNTARLHPRELEKKERAFGFVKNREKYINVGEKAVKNHRALLERIRSFGETHHYLHTQGLPQREWAIVTRGNSYQHVLEAIEVLGIEEKTQVIQVLGVYPIPKVALLKELKHKKKIIIVEDQDGFLEQQIKMELFNDLDAELHGKDWFPAYGELNVGEVIEILASNLNIPYQTKGLEPATCVERLGTFCEGCPHTSSYFAIEQAVPESRRIIGGDIGCSSLPPFRADWLLCMNAGIGMSLGIRPFLTDQSIVSTGGDGSFFHGGLLTVLNAVQNNSSLLHVVFDNRSVAMTGHQESPSKHVDYKALILALGVDSFTEVSAWDPKQIQSIIAEKEHLSGVHIVWISGNCARIPDDRSRYRQANLYPEIDPKKCLDCQLCYKELACPAIEMTPIGSFEIQLDRCMRCGVCHEICPNGAITIHTVNHEE
ncbi:MAG: hypothetical protein RL632_1988 [Bacteroidota bacterium]